MTEGNGDRVPRLLLVDDEERILTALRRSLRREGYELVLAQTPREALERLGEQPFDAVLSDHKMPGMTGVELLERAARLQPDAARVLITGWAHAVPREEMEAAPIDVVLPKPWEDAELKTTLRKLLRSR
jgi:CheY-like chemotaxis protein